VREEIFKGKSVVFTGKLSSLPRVNAQDIVRDLGGSTPRTVNRNLDYLVVGEEGYLQAIEKSHKLTKAEEINQAEQQIQIIPESTFLKMVGIKSREELKKSLYPGRTVTRKFGLNRAQLRYLERWGVIRSSHRTNVDTYYDFRDLLIIRRVSQSLEKGARLSHITKALHEELVGGQLFFRFEKTGLRQVVTLDFRKIKTGTADQWFEQGYELEQNPNEIDQAIEAYTRALDIDPNYTDAIINLGNLLYEKGNTDQARQLYEKALEIDRKCCQAHLNLGNIYDDLQDYGNALKHFKRALEINSDYADVRFNMAIVYEKLGLGNNARRQWKEYLKIDPHSEWADLVRKHLGRIL